MKPLKPIVSQKMGARATLPSLCPQTHPGSSCSPSHTISYQVPYTVRGKTTIPPHLPPSPPERLSPPCHDPNSPAQATGGISREETSWPRSFLGPKPSPSGSTGSWSASFPPTACLRLRRTLGLLLLTTHSTGPRAASATVQGGRCCWDRRKMVGRQAVLAAYY